MPIAGMLVDVATKHGVLTFMDGYSGYNQIFMVVEDVNRDLITNVVTDYRFIKRDCLHRDLSYLIPLDKSKQFNSYV